MDKNNLEHRGLRSSMLAHILLHPPCSSMQVYFVTSQERFPEVFANNFIVSHISRAL